ncbi:MAG: hypothetical protein FWF88_10400 [Peptococcaceae bacterium]|nr:hypothetical protein [Peptococcaceae bacterium]
MAKKNNDIFAGFEEGQSLEGNLLQQKETPKIKTPKETKNPQTFVKLVIIFTLLGFFAIAGIGIFLFVNSGVTLINMTNDMINEQREVFDKGIPSESQNQFGNQRFHNIPFSLASGTKSGILVRTYIDSVIDNNKKVAVGSGYGKFVSVVFNGTETSDTTELKNIKLEIANTANYEVEADYDPEGYIYRIIIDKL